jgi:hypothetical protein
MCFLLPGVIDGTSATPAIWANHRRGRKGIEYSHGRNPNQK